MFNRILAVLFVVVSVSSVFAKEHLRFDARYITLDSINSIIEKMPEDGYYEVSYEGLLCYKALLEKNPQSYNDVLNLVTEVFANSTSTTGTDIEKARLNRLVTQQICFNRRVFLIDAYKLSTEFPFMQVKYLIDADTRAVLGYTPNDAFNIISERLLNSSVWGEVEVVNSLISLLPQVTLDDSDVLSVLKRLNRKYSKYLTDDKTKSVYEPVVALIRTTIATY